MAGENGREVHLGSVEMQNSGEEAFLRAHALNL